MKLDQVALILYTLRDHCKTPSDLNKTLGKVKEIGYPAVQVSGIGEVDPAELRKMLDDNGLVACATHEPGARILQETDAVIDKLKTLGVTHTAYPYPKDIDFADPAALDTLVAQLDAAGAKMADAGLVLMYHNHAIEFVRHKGVPFLQYVYDHTDPKHLQAEPDTYWLQAGGVNPVTFIEPLKGRLPVLHIKDYVYSPANRPVPCEIGSGWLDFPAIIAAAEACGCQWFVVEQDTCPGDPFDSVKQSFEYIQANLIA